MNTKKIITVLSVFLLTMVAFVSCVKDTDYELPSTKMVVPAFDGDIVTFAQAISASTTDIKDYEKNEAIEGYVVSSDEGGNFYKKIYLQNEDKTQGISVAIDKSGLYGDFPIGAKVQIRLKGLTTQLVNDKLEIGYGTYTNAAGTRSSVGNMPAAPLKNNVFNLGEPLKTKEELAKASTSVDELKINDNLNQLVTFKNVSFEAAAVGSDFHVSANDAYAGTNYDLIDANGKKVIFRTGRYANFIKEKVPAGLLDVTGVLTKYGSTYQFMISNTDDIKVVGSGNNGGGGTSGTVISTFPYNEDFTGSSTALPNGWNTISTKGTRKWEVRQHNNVNYVQMTAYASSGALDVTTWLIAPKFNLDVDTHVLKVKLADAFQNGNPLKVMYSTNYSGSGDPSSATWTQIGATQIAALINNSTNYDNVYEESAAIPLNFRGEVHIAFVYESGGSISTTVQLQNVYIGADSGNTTPTPTPPVTSGQKTVKEIRDLYTSSAVDITDDISIKVKITSDKDAKNVANRLAYAQDDTAGIALFFSADNTLALGDEVTINLNGAKLDKYNGLLQISNISTTNIVDQASGTAPAPKVITLAEALTGNYEGQLVSISGVQFKETAGTYSGSKAITDCTNELTVYTRSQATFASTALSDKKGTITGNISNHTSGVQLILRNVSDVNFTDTYTDCNGTVTPTPNPTPTTGTAVLSSDFASITEGNSTANTGSLKRWEGDDKWNVDTAYQAGGAVKLGTGSKIGYIETKDALGTTGKIKVTVKVKGWTNIEGTLNVIVGAVTKEITYTAKMGDSFETQSVEFENVQATDKLKIETSAKRAFIDEVKVEKL